MRGADVPTGEVFSYVDLEKRVPTKHPLRLVRSSMKPTEAADPNPNRDQPGQLKQQDTGRSTGISAAS